MQEYILISNVEMEDISKIVKSLEGSGLLLKGVTETVQNEVKEQKGGFLSMLLGTLDASLLGNILAGKGVIATRQGLEINRAGKGWGINRAADRVIVTRQGRGIVRAGYGRHSLNSSKNKKDQKNNKMDF